MSYNSNTSTPPIYFVHTLSANNVCSIACAGIPGSTILYTDKETLNNGEFLYQNQLLTIPASNGCYAKVVSGENTNFQVFGGLGYITNSQYCG